MDMSLRVENAEEAESHGDEMDDEEEREQWSSRADFLLSVLGFAIGLGNVWRFPYLCYKNGGGAFFVPYFVCLICGGAPILFLEIALGQYMKQGGLGCWKICPMFSGVGISSAVIVFLTNIYYIVVLAWAVNYMCYAFNSVLPWSHCENEWNTARCQVSFIHNCTEEPETNESYLVKCINGSVAMASNFTPVDPVIEFWENKILQISSGIDQPGGIVWQLALSLLFVWILCYLCLWKGVKWTGKVVYFTATFPFFMLIVLLIRGLTLDGAREGIIFYLNPDFSKLAESQVWIDAGTQIFFSYAIALGSMVALGSYNKFHSDCYRDCIIISCVNSCTSVFAGFAIFSVLGFMAKEQGVSIENVAESGPGLAFIAYPKAVTQMPFPQVWAVLFFLMILMLGLDSQFVGCEGFITVIMDAFPKLRKSYNREVFVGLYCFGCFLVGLTMVTKGGMYVFQLFDYYSASGMVLLWCCFFECIAIAWVYGGVRFYDNIQQMIGYRINPWLRICWTILSPVVCAGIFIFMWVKFQPLKYNRTYEYPLWGQALGMCLAFMSMICIPLTFIIKFIKHPGTWRERLIYLKTPVLIPSRIPPHWTDAEFLKEFSYQERLKATGCNSLFGCCDSKKIASPHTNAVLYQRKPIQVDTLFD